MNRITCKATPDAVAFSTHSEVRFMQPKHRGDGVRFQTDKKSLVDGHFREFIFPLLVFQSQS